MHAHNLGNLAVLLALICLSKSKSISRLISLKNYDVLAKNKSIVLKDIVVKSRHIFCQKVACSL